MSGFMVRVLLILELFPVLAGSRNGAIKARREDTGEETWEGVTQMKIAASEAVVPTVSVHKAG
jgi:hypothetical protein